MYLPPADSRLQSIKCVFVNCSLYFSENNYLGSKSFLDKKTTIILVTEITDKQKTVGVIL